MTLDSKEGTFLSSSRKSDDAPTMQIVDCIERGLNHYGATMTRVVFWNFEKKFGLQKADISKYPEKFVLSIEGMFAGELQNVEKNTSSKK